MISDKEIAEAFQISDNEGYRKLIDAYGNYVYTIITDKVRGLASEQDKEECVADVFMETVKECKSHGFTMDSLNAVIAVVSKRRSVNLLKKLSARKLQNYYLDEIDEEPVYNETPETLSVSKSEKETLWNEVLNLGKPDSDIITLQFFYGKTVAEIAKTLKMTTSAVNKRSQRAREKLGKILTLKEVF